MLEFKTRLVTPALLLLAGIALLGCSPTQEGKKYPVAATTAAIANFDLTTGKLPYPWDAFFAGSTDGTLRIPAAAAAIHQFQSSLNQLDGWSTSATVDTSFTLPIDPTTINANTVKIIKLWVDPATKAPTTNPAYLPGTPPAIPQLPFVDRVLTYGVDYTADVSPDFDSGGKYLRITPLKPFHYSSGPAYNSGVNAGKILNANYVVLLTNGLHSTDGKTYQPDALYAGIQAAPANCSTITDPTAQQICLLTKAHLGIAGGLFGASFPASVVLSWSFSTQSVDDTLAYLSAVTAASPAQPALIVPTGLTTKNLSASLAGHADVYVGSTKLPYFQTPAANNHDTSILTKHWTAAGAPPAPFDPTSRNVTMFNPVPLKVADVTVPLIVSVPNANSACPAKPANGWPVVIVQHGVTGNRSQAMAVADAFADACFVVAAIDLPLHGITDATKPEWALHCTPAVPQCLGATERTFDVDLVNNSTGAPGPDGKIDPSGGFAGTTFFYLGSPLTARDNFRQAESDLITFTKAVTGLAIAAPTGVTPIGVDPTRVSFVGLSLGAIVGGSHTEFAGAGTRTSTLAVPGGTIMQLLKDSASFGPIVNALLGGSVAPNSYAYNLTLRDLQAIIDAGDPINHIADAALHVPTHIIKVLNDQVVPNNATDRLILQGGLTKLKTAGPHAVTAGAGAYTFFSKGSHGSLFDPTASLAATVEMQKESVLFAASAVQPGGPFVVLTDLSVIDTN